MIVKNKLLNYSNAYIYQDTEYFKMSLDSLLLAKFVTINMRDKNIIDLATGNAPIPMLLTYRTKAHICGVEIQEEVYNLANLSIKKIRELIVFTALLVVALWKFDVVLDVLKTIGQIIFPFILGGAIVFVINVPMSFLEKKIFENVKKENKAARKLARPVSLLLTIVLVVGVIALVMIGVIPQLTKTMGSLMINITDFIPQIKIWIRDFFHDNREIMKLVDQVQFKPDQAIRWGISLLGNGAGNMMNTTMSAVGSVVSGLATFFIAFSFACYVLFQKEKLHVQIRKVLFAFLPKQKADAFLKVCSLTYRTFANFLTGQCLEAVILGCMFVVTLSILRMPYALLIGVLIAFTALIAPF